MNLVATYQQRLRDELGAVENEIKSHNQQIEELNRRLEGLKRASELMDSESAAILELLHAGTNAENGAPRVQQPASPRAAAKTAMRKSASRQATRKSTAAPAGMRPSRLLGVRAQKATQAQQAQLAQMREANRNGKAKRTDLIAAVLRATPQVTVREIIGALNKEFGWQCRESNLTGHLYTNPEMFIHTKKSDHSRKNPVRWSLNNARR